MIDEVFDYSEDLELTAHEDRISDLTAKLNEYQPFIVESGTFDVYSWTHALKRPKKELPEGMIGAYQEKLLVSGLTYTKFETYLEITELYSGEHESCNRQMVMELLTYWTKKLQADHITILSQDETVDTTLESLGCFNTTNDGLFTPLRVLARGAYFLGGKQEYTYLINPSSQQEERPAPLADQSQHHG